MTGRLTHFEVSNLIGHFYHSVDFPSSDEFVIVHGPNGVGKTHLLRLMHAVLSRRVWSLRSIRFDSAIFVFDDEHVIKVNRRQPNDNTSTSLSVLDQPSRQETEIEIALYKNDVLIERWSDLGRQEPKVLGPQTRRFLEIELGIERVGADEWFDTQNELFLTTDEVLNNLTVEPGSLPSELEGLIKPLSAEISEYLSHSSSRLVETQRLLTTLSHRDARRGRPMMARQSTVAEFARDLARNIREKQAENARIASQLDRTFPRRVLQETRVVESTDALLERYQKQDRLRSQLEEAALLDEAAGTFGLTELDLSNRALDDTERKLLATYLEDGDKKLGVFRDTLQRIELFREILNERFLYKSVHIDSASGFYFLTDENEQLRPELLSSGEQHELVVLYELLFKTERESVVLIDEPEISLHVKWQREFLNDLLRIAQLTRLRFIIATHSPQIVGGWTDRAVMLEANNE
jgi:predicted ATP-binding protein involved in virulence